MRRQTAERPVAARVRLALLAAVAALVAMAIAPAASSAALEFETITGAYEDPYGSGDLVRQAGAHPDVTFRFTVPPDDPDVPVSYPVDQPHRLIAGMPPGLVGNPQAVATCPESLLKAGPNGNSALCPAESQVGVAAIISPGGSATTVAPVYNLERPADAPALFAFNYISVVTKLQPSVRPGDFGIDIDSGTISQGLVMIGAEVTLWGVPFDSSHDSMRPVDGNLLTCLPGFGCFGGGQAADGVPRPFLSLPTECSGEPLVTTGLIDGWREIGEFGSASFDTDSDGQPFVLTGCEELPFAPEVAVAATATATDVPSGVDVELKVPQTDDVDLAATAHVRDVRMVLPEGFAVSPSSAVGLGACSLAQIDLSSNAEPACPRSSKLGTIVGETPLLDERLTGDVILATPDDNPFGSLIALYLVVRGPGVLMKIPGEVQADPRTGRLTATFENNPQLPFSSLRVRFDGGENASLVSPVACGRYVTGAGVSSWSGKSVDLTSPIAIDQGCGPRGFEPGFAAGSVNPVAGGESAFAVSLERPDRTQEVSTLSSLKLPEGLLGHVSKVDVCPDAAADAGNCGEGSRIGHVQIAAGPGGAPVWVPERGKAPTSVSLAGPYKGAPYSLSVVVPAQAGPFNLGRVVARSPLHIDRRTAQLSTGIDVSRVFDRRGNLTQTVQGGMPTIVEGIPLRLRELRVVVDRDGFAVNPTSCEPTSVDATLRSTGGQSKQVSSRFQVGECASLGFSPRLGMRLLGKRQTTTGRHPALRTVLTQPGGQANIGLARVVMPRSIVLDPENSVDPELVCDYDVGQRGDCDASSVIGRARAVSPLLKRPLRGTVHLVQGIRFGPTGNRIRTTPSLLVKLRGEVDIDLHGRTTVHAGRLVTVFKQVPDARVSRFALRINGGRKGILVVTGSRRGNIDICDSRQTANLRFVGHNGKRTSQRQIVRTPCRKAGNKAQAGKRNAKTGKRNTGRR